MALLNSKKKQDDENKLGTPYKLDAKMNRRLQTIMAGSVRAPHRLKHSNHMKCDLCDHPQCCQSRCDTKHIFWDCHKFSHIRSKYTNAIQNKLKQLKKLNPVSFRDCKKMMELPCFQQCGICPGDKEALRTTYEL